MKFILEKKDIYAALTDYVQAKYGEDFKPHQFFFGTGERYVPVKNVEVLVKEIQSNLPKEQN